MRFVSIADIKVTSVVVAWARQVLKPSAQLVIDGFASGGAAVTATAGAIIVAPGHCSDLAPFRWFNAFIANLRVSCRETDHRQVNKYTCRYLAEVQYRGNRRCDLHAIVRRPQHTCALAAPYLQRWLHHGGARVTEPLAEEWR